MNNIGYLNSIIPIEQEYNEYVACSLIIELGSCSGHANFAYELFGYLFSVRQRREVHI